MEPGVGLLGLVWFISFFVFVMGRLKPELHMLGKHSDSEPIASPQTLFSNKMCVLVGVCVCVCMNENVCTCVWP